MAEQLKILVIEDEEKNVRTIEQAFIDTVDKLKEWDLLDKMKFQHINMEWICGTDKVTKRGKDYLFYTDQVLDELDKKIAKKADGRIGILLDVVLTREEDRKSVV